MGLWFREVKRRRFSLVFRAENHVAESVQRLAQRILWTGSPCSVV